MKHSDNLLHIIIIFYCNKKMYITKVYIDNIVLILEGQSSICNTRYSTIDEFNTEQPQENHTQSSHLAAKLI